MHYKVPAVVVGAGINGLGVIRSLAGAGVPVIVLDDDQSQPGMHSRHGKKLTYQGNIVDALVELGRCQIADGMRPVLFLTQERVVSEVSTHRELLAPFFRFSLPASPVLDQLLHKDTFHSIAEKMGAPIPKTEHVTACSDLGCLDRLMPPLIVKPSFHDSVYEQAFRKAYKVESVRDAEVLVKDILQVMPDVVVQEWIDGNDSDIYFCLQYLRHSDGPVTSFVGRKIRSWPPVVGGTASCMRAMDGLALIEPTTRFFCHTGVIGLASMEYKKDRRTGRFVMIEPTVGRTDYQEEVATLNGINIPLASYCSELGLPLPVSNHSSQMYVWRDREADRNSALQDNAANHITLPPARVVDALWRFSDPMPAARKWVRRIGSRVERLSSQIVRVNRSAKRIGL